jgi:hypothetical protein
MLLNYSYLDILTNTAYLVLYPTQSYNSSAVAEQSISSTNSLGSPTKTSDDFDSEYNTFAKEGDYDFDILLNRPLDIKGKVFIEFTQWVTGGNTSYDGGYIYCIVKLRKWDGSTETELGNGKSSQFSEGTDSTDYQRNSVIINLTSKTHFKTGEYLRITIEVWGAWSDTNSNQKGGIYTDPSNSQTVTSGSEELATSIKVHLPTILQT